jgi:hypothetical protein
MYLLWWSVGSAAVGRPCGSALVAVLWWRLRGRPLSAVASLCFVLFFFLKIYLTLAWRGEREMAEQKKVGSATGAAVLILFEGGGW